MRLLLDGSSIGVEDDEREWVEDDEGEAVEDDRDETSEDDDTSAGSVSLLLDDDSARLVGASALDESSEHDAKLKSTLAAIGARIL